MSLFGHIKDMETFWSCPLDMRKFPWNWQQEFSITKKVFAEHCVLEIYLVTNFLKAIGREVHWTLEDSWNVFANHFIVVNHEDLDVYWPKYNSNREFRFLYYDSIRGTQVMNFREWLNLYSGLSNKVLS